MFKDYNQLTKENLNSINNINPKKLFVLNMLVGNEISNMKLFLDTEEAILAGVDKNIILKNMFLNINKSKKFIRFPSKKKRKYENQWLYKILQKHYGWSYARCHEYWELIEMRKKEFAKKLGLDNRQRRKLGLKPIKIKVEKLKKIDKGQRCLFA